MRKRLVRAWDLVYRTLFGALVGLGVLVAVEELVLAETHTPDARAGWEVIAYAVAICAGILAARAIRWHRRRQK